MNFVLRKRVNVRLIVTLKAGQSFAGVLWSQDHQALVLRNASALGEGDQGEAPIPVDGEVIILLVDVAYIQRP